VIDFLPGSSAAKDWLAATLVVVVLIVWLWSGYTTNAAAEKTLGFAWDVELRTDIESSDGINVLVFVTGQRVASYLEHPRHQDFWKLSGHCFRRNEAIFVKQEGSYVTPFAQQAVQPDRREDAAPG